MFRLNDVTLRCLDIDDVDAAYAWHLDTGIEIAAGWIRPRSTTTFRNTLEEALKNPPANFQNRRHP